jgi:hypothetical protein
MFYFKFVPVLLSLMVTCAFAEAPLPPPDNVISVVQIHQPYIDREMMLLNYDWQQIKSKFPQAQLEGSTAKYVKNRNETIWRISADQKVRSVTFIFATKLSQKFDAETALLKKYKEQISPEKFSALHGRRELVVTDTHKTFELLVSFPLSDYEWPYIRAVTLNGSDLSR